jgi:pSer/pThr/pTyr-binding forkhead associated (FHA) protein
MSAVIVLIIRILIAVSLYLFLGLAVFTLWKEVHETGEKRSRSLVPEISLTYTDELEQTRTFNQNEVTIGRDSTCDLVIPNDTVSSHHARLSFHHKQWWLEDLQSTNGTFLNNERLYTSTVIVSGDDLMLGNISLQISIKELK